MGLRNKVYPATEVQLKYWSRKSLPRSYTILPTGYSVDGLLEVCDDRLTHPVEGPLAKLVSQLSVQFIRQLRAACRRILRIHRAAGVHGLCTRFTVVEERRIERSRQNIRFAIPRDAGN